MIVKIKTFSGETLYIPEEDYPDEVMYSNGNSEELVEQKDKEAPLSKKEKAALGTTAAAGLGIAGLGQKHANAKKKEYLKRSQKWLESYGWAEDKAKKEAKENWKLFEPRKRSLKKLRKNIKDDQKWIDEVEKLGKKAADEDLGNINVYKHALSQGKTLLSRKKGKITANTGLALTGAAAACGGYKLYKHNKNKKK